MIIQNSWGDIKVEYEAPGGNKEKVGNDVEMGSRWQGSQILLCYIEIQGL